MTKKKLFDEESEEEEVSLKTENDYAKKYDRWREKEELHKLEQKYGSKSLGSDGSESDSEDESDEPPEINEEVEVQFLKTLSLLKTKDPRIYDPNYKFFDEKIEKENEKKEEVKKVTFADSDDDDDDGPNIFSIEKKAEIDEPVKKDAKTEDGKLKDFLTGKAEHIDDDVEKDLAPLKSLWSDPKLNDGEAFLRDYILNKRYLDDDDDGKVEDKVRDDEDLEADEKTVEEQGKFERAYNFRFEEPDEEYLKRYPRTMNYIRPKDDRRSRKRAEIRERKEQEKKKKMEEIARLKALKLKEIQEKIAKIKEVTGNDDLAFEEQDIEGDFDPEEHDKRMKELFDEQFYGQADDEKPVFPDLDEELEIENWENYENEKQNVPNEDGPHCEDEDFNMDADYDPKKAKENLVEELKRNVGKKRRNRKRKSKLAEILAEDKPKFVPDVEKTYSEFMEEYYKMDCEDVIGGDLPTRFKYREVVPNDYGLSIEEILLADDKELTQWVPLKKIVKYRPENVEKSEVNTYRQKAADERLKRKVLPSLFKDLPEEPEVVVPIEETIKKKKKKKKKNKAKNEDVAEVSNNGEATEQNEVIESNDMEVTNEVKIKKNKKKKHKYEDSQNPSEMNAENNSKNVVDDDVSNVNDKDNNSAIDVNEGRKKKKQKTTDASSSVQINGDNEVVEENEQINKDSKKKKKNKQTNKDSDNIQSNSEITQSNTEKSINNIIVTNFGKKKKRNSFTVEDVHSEFSKASTNGVFNKTQGQKRKANFNDDRNAPKKKKNKKQYNNEMKKTSNDKSSDNKNPLSKLSDERLKAYGLNPKKYRSFLKYKKF
ncbi:protein KRI1 homolog [Zerene cesonia]|uniref:protein KRI1 homolog n=1 Tax=Zerene cesonia TaxID=33412 RepID=UPI0018E4EB00|nr:protein KRI1 homolog [Zerene cesonia]